MDAAKYFIRGVTMLATDPGLQEALSRVYESSERPRCMCVRGGVEMYIAKHGEYVVKRMPGTGDMHHPTCQSSNPSLASRAWANSSARPSSSTTQITWRSGPTSRSPGSPARQCREGRRTASLPP
jgi:hypothetical protein